MPISTVQLDRFWNKNKFLAWVLISTAGGLAIWAVYCPFSPGISIGLLALMAGIMSVRPEMHIFEKMAWIGILIAFTILEVHAIGRSDEENKAQRVEQNEKFAGIARGLSDSYRLSQKQFSDTMNQFSQSSDTRNQQFKALVEQDRKLFLHEQSLAESLSGKLVAGHFPTPPNPCASLARPGVTFVFMDSNATFLTKFPYTILQVNGKPIFQIDKTAAGAIFPLVDIRGRDGKIIARLDSEGYVIGNRLQVKRPDPSTLAVIDDYGETAITLRLLNRNSIEISGHLFYKEKELPLGFPKMFRGSCVAGGSVAESLVFP